MDVKYFPLGATESNNIIKIIRIIFGVICLAVAVMYPFMLNLNSIESDGTFWITVVFLSGFGIYQVWAGAGLATRFIEIGPDFIRLKKNPVFRAVTMKAEDIERIELFPLNTVFFLKSLKHIMLRFGTTFYETNDKIKDELLLFTEANNIPVEIIDEKI